MRIALVAPPWYSLPPDGYGGIEAMCATLADGLVARGHDVVTIGAGSGGTKAHHIATYETPPSHRMGDRFLEVNHALKTTEILASLEVDIVHDHSLVGPLVASTRAAPTVVTSHFTVSGERGDYYIGLRDTVSMVAVSRAQRRLSPTLPWIATVPNALAVDEVPFTPQKSDYLLWLGRMVPEKGAAEAIDVARRAGRRLIIAGKCTEQREKEYFDHAIRPKLGPGIEWIGEAHASDKWALLGEASALLFPITWDEPFGMVMIEAMATGTPVVALCRGSVPEVVVSHTGFVCGDLDAMTAAIDELDTIDPTACRRHVADHFDISHMVAGYEAAYAAVSEGVGQST
jgi:glycosyltransferase involved in cell wall biosynthesis